MTGSEAHALSLLSAISAALAVLAMAALFRAVDSGAAPAWTAVVRRWLPVLRRFSG